MVAARVATDLLRRPHVADQAMRDDLAKHTVNRAQVDHTRHAADPVRQCIPALPRLERTREFIDLVGACAVFVSSMTRIVPEPRGHPFTEDERATVARNVARVCATCDWVEIAVESAR